MVTEPQCLARELQRCFDAVGDEDGVPMDGSNDGASPNDEAGLDRVRWGLRFVLPEVERAYRAWNVRKAVPVIRGAGIATSTGWLLLLVPMWLSRRAGFAWAAGWIVLVLVPSIVACIVVSYRPSRIAWMLPAIMLASTLSGVSAVIISWLWGMESVSMAGVVVCSYFAFASIRLRPEQALFAVMPYVGLHQAWMVVSFRGGRLGLAELAMYSALPWIAVQVALFTNTVLERLSREAYRQERIIESQRQTIVRERARSEALLKQEVSHQVAARSRELGQMLAKTDATFVVGRLSPGDRFDTRYVVQRALGSGGMGAVFEVERLTDGERLALKVVTGQITGAQAARFAREAEIGAGIHHRNLVSIVDVGIAPGGVPFLAMEIADGGSLEDRRERFGDAAWALPILREIAEGLAALHDAGVVHRDLKPGNVLFTGSDATAVAKISDFGISRFGALASDSEVDPKAPTMAPTSVPARGSATDPAKRAGLTATGTMLGTPFYMAPESVLGAHAVNAPADVFAFGIIALEMLTGRAPFVTPPIFLAMAGQQIPAPEVHVAGIDEPVRGVLMRCLVEDPAKRPTIVEVCAVLSSRPTARSG